MQPAPTAARLPFEADLRSISGSEYSSSCEPKPERPKDVPVAVRADEKAVRTALERLTPEHSGQN